LRLREQCSHASVIEALDEEDAVKNAFVNALKSLLSLYGLGTRRRRAAIQIGPAGVRRPA
jgi:hypothetical protein